MKIVHELPPIYGAILEAGLTPNLGHVLFAYGDILYIPGGFTPSQEVFDHEKTHSRQQAETDGGKDAWWERYLGDIYFRATQEAEAYATQYLSFCSRNRDRNAQARYMHYVAGQLSGPLYGRIVNRTDARKMITAALK